MTDVNDLLDNMKEHVKVAGDIKEFLHPIATEAERADVIAFLIACVDNNHSEDFAKQSLLETYSFNKTCEKDIFSEIVLFTYRTLIAYKEQLNSEKNEKDNLTDNSPCSGVE